MRLVMEMRIQGKSRSVYSVNFLNSKLYNVIFIRKGLMKLYEHALEPNSLFSSVFLSFTLKVENIQIFRIVR